MADHQAVMCKKGSGRPHVGEHPHPPVPAGTRGEGGGGSAREKCRTFPAYGTYQRALTSPQHMRRPQLHTAPPSAARQTQEMIQHPSGT